MVLVTTSPPATPCPHRPSHLELGLQTFPALCVMKFTRRLASIARNMLLQRVLPLSFVLPLALQWQAGSSARCDARLIMFSGAPLSIISGTARACEHNCSHGAETNMWYHTRHRCLCQVHPPSLCVQFSQSRRMPYDARQQLVRINEIPIKRATALEWHLLNTP
jgi:hypothetical protein